MRFQKPHWVRHEQSYRGSHQEHGTGTTTQSCPIYSVDVQSTGKRFATGGADAQVRIWSTAPAISPVAELGDEMYAKVESALQTSKTELDKVKDTPSSGGDDGIKVPRCLAKLTAHTATVNIVRWSHGGRFLATGSEDGLIYIWELRPEAQKSSGGFGMGSGQQQEEEDLEVWCKALVLGEGDSEIQDLAWSPCDCRIASVSFNGNLSIWDLRKGIMELNSTYKEYRNDKLYKKYSEIKPKGTKNTVFVRKPSLKQKAHDIANGVSWDPVGTYIATAGNDNSVAVWRMEEQTCILEQRVSAPYEKCREVNLFRRLDWSPDGMSLVTTSGMNSSRFVSPILARKDCSVVANLVGHKKAVGVSRCLPRLLSKRLSPQYSHVCCALGDNEGVLSFWKTDQPSPFVVVDGAFTGHITDASWGVSPSGESQFLLASAIDGTVGCLVLTEGEVGVVADPTGVKSKISTLYGSHVFDKMRSWTYTSEVLAGFNSVNEHARDVSAEKLAEGDGGTSNFSNLSQNNASSTSTPVQSRSSRESALSTQKVENKGGRKRLVPQLCTEDDIRPNSKRQRTNAVNISTSIKKCLAWIYSDLTKRGFDIHDKADLEVSLVLDSVQDSGGSFALRDRSGTPSLNGQGGFGGGAFSGSLMHQLLKNDDIGIIGPNGVPSAVEPFIAKFERASEAQAQGISECDPRSDGDEETGVRSERGSSSTFARGSILSSHDAWQALQAASASTYSENDTPETESSIAGACLLCPPPRRSITVFYLQGENDEEARWCLESTVRYKPTVQVDRARDVESHSPKIPVSYIQLVENRTFSICWKTTVPADVCAAAAAHTRESQVSCESSKHVKPTFVVIGTRNGIISFIGRDGERLVPSAALGTPICRLSIRQKPLSSVDEYTRLLGLERYVVAALGCDGLIRMWTVTTVRRASSQNQETDQVNGEEQNATDSPWASAFPKCLFRMYVSKAEVLSAKPAISSILADIRHSQDQFPDTYHRSANSPEQILQPFYGALVDHFKLNSESQPQLTVRAQKFTLGSRDPSVESDRKARATRNFARVISSVRKTLTWCCAVTNMTTSGVQTSYGSWQTVTQPYTLSSSSDTLPMETDSVLAPYTQSVSSVHESAKERCSALGALWLPSEELDDNAPRSFLKDTCHSVRKTDLYKEYAENCNDSELASFVSSLYDSSEEASSGEPSVGSQESEWLTVEKLTLVEEAMLQFQVLCKPAEYRRYLREYAKLISQGSLEARAESLCTFLLGPLAPARFGAPVVANMSSRKLLEEVVLPEFKSSLVGMVAERFRQLLQKLRAAGVA
eukprot:gb/GECG01014321.1/.p1 GENE.gb/GECG01014321.1/~~gb/GECG01014321.1/.p1  ORF type:complete len:1308 (+),score=175.08 gb/GECG01014321.1/:1-3924(+)